MKRPAPSRDEDSPARSEARAGWFPWLALTTSVTTYALVIVGGIVRTTESGDACPDWPRCHGDLIPPLSGHVLIEFSHRLLATVVGLLVVATLIAAWRSQRRSPIVVWGAAAALALVGGQIVLGGMTVLNDLSSSLVMAHLATAASLLAALIVVTIASARPAMADSPSEAATPLRNIAIVAALATLALMLSGSYVSGTGAGLAFRDWPLFDGRLMPDGGRLAMIHAAHRFAALLIGIILAYLLWRASQWRTANPRWFAIAMFAFALYVTQAFVGAANIWTRLQPAASAAHLALAMALWATLVSLATIAHLATAPSRRPATEAVATGQFAASSALPARGPS